MPISIGHLLESTGLLPDGPRLGELVYNRFIVVGAGKYMKPLARITFDRNVMGGKPCIRGMRVTVGTIVGLVASGHTFADILKAYPYLEEADLREALAYAAWRVEEIELPLAAA